MCIRDRARGVARAAVAKLAAAPGSYPGKAVWSLAGLRVFDADAKAFAIALDIPAPEQITAEVVQIGQVAPDGHAGPGWPREGCCAGG
eukprot:11944063-Alexandrium_andersonii.AAC.1